MADDNSSQAVSAISTLKTLPEETFCRAVVLLMVGHSTSFVARWLLSLPDRGCLETATFDALRTYLRPINKQVRKWRQSLYRDPIPAVVLEAQKWLERPTEGSD